MLDDGTGKKAEPTPRYCDIVMKGGITSGIVYPAAVVEIARRFVFKNIGGTSAGAIAASLTAAAERQRYATGSNAGFERIARIPDWLMQDRRLFRLFVPSRQTRSLFRTVVGLFGRTPFRPAWLAKWCGLIAAFPVAAVLGAIPGIGFLIVALRMDATAPAWLLLSSLALAIATMLAFMTLAAAISLGRDLLGKLRANAYGMVTGIDDANRSNSGALCKRAVQLAADRNRTVQVRALGPFTASRARCEFALLARPAKAG
jgi:hypothetical protein